MPSHLLEIEGLTAWYRPQTTILQDLSLALPEHEVIGLIGLNGAGKTTLIHILSGIHNGYRLRQAYFHGDPLNFAGRAFKLKRYTVFSEDHSFAYFTFDEYLQYVCRSYGSIPDPAQVRFLLDGFQFADQRTCLLKDLSTGNRQKVYLMTAFALHPELLLLDEPVNNLDFQSTEFLYRLMQDYRAYGTLMFSSHILESICLTSDRVFVLEQGRMRHCMTKDEIRPELIREALHDSGDL